MDSFTHYLNGNFVTEDRLLISPRDLGFTRSYMVFEYLRTYNSVPFMLSSYLLRLIKSAELIGIQHNYNLKILEEIIYATLRRNEDGKEKSIKIMLSGGISNMLHQSSDATLVIIVDLFRPKDEQIYETGVKVNLVKYTRYRPEAKSPNYIEAIIQAKINKTNCVFESIYYSDDQIFEGSTSNIFVVKENSVYTPSTNVLKGITRHVVLYELMYQNVFEKNFNIDFLYDADEVFITSSGKQIVPVIAIGNKLVQKGRIGKITRKIMNDFKQYVNSYTYYY